MSRTYEYRNGIKNSIKLSYTYRGLIDDPSVSKLNKILDDYVNNGKPYINTEINIDSNKIRSSTMDKTTKYKFVINLYNDKTKGDTFTILPIMITGQQ